jgi:hypothetical protein
LDFKSGKETKKITKIEVREDQKWEKNSRVDSNL